MDFWRVIAILNRRKWLIVLSVAVTAVLTGGATRLMKSKWVATVQFMRPERIPGTGIGARDGEDVDSGDKGDVAVYDTIVKSQDVLEPAFAQLGISKIPSDFPKNVSFEASGPRQFQLQVNDTSAPRAERMANTLADQFIKVYHYRRTEQVRKSVILLEQNLREADAKLAEARHHYDYYRARHQIVSTLNDSVETALAHLKSARLKREDLDQRVANARAQLQAKEIALKQLPATIPVVKAAEPSLLAKRLEEELDKAEQQLEALHERYTDSWPLVKQAIAHRDSLRARLKQETAREITTIEQPNPDATTLQIEIGQLRQEISGAEAESKSLDASLAEARQEVDRFKGIDSPISALTAEIAQEVEARSALVTRLNNARMSQDAVERQNPITITSRVGEYNPPVNSTSGRTLKLVLMAALGALLCTSGLIIALDSIDRGLKTVKEAEIVLPTRVIAAIPQPFGAITYADMARISELQPMSLQAESYRFLGLHLLNECSPNIKSLMVLSAKAEQGSTTALTNLAITLAQAGKRVVLVDANIRTAELHCVFGLPNRYGYVDLLQDPTDSSLVHAMHATTIDNLNVITSGPTPDNPWQLFRSENLREVSRRLHEVADYILYDTPSSLMFTDALNLAPVVDAAFLSIRALQPLTGGEQRIIEQLQHANVTILGAVLNDVPATLLEGYHNYQHYYMPGVKQAVVALPSGVSEDIVSIERLSSKGNGN